MAGGGSAAQGAHRPAVSIRIDTVGPGGALTLGTETDLGADTTPPCPADLTGDGSVDGQDLGLLLSSWNGDGPAALNGDGSVDGVDLGLMLSAWGACAAD